ncbi:MAG TPA: hypothetical protein VKA25_05410 [Gemmatimonadales bacterium]|nr:hypothetical protein [Gemmatimonadales bacterium]
MLYQLSYTRGRNGGKGGNSDARRRFLVSPYILPYRRAAMVGVGFEPT